VLSNVRRSGVRVAIDDFGTGYSSFAQFRDLPADELKIDRSFITNLTRSPIDERIVQSIIELAHSLGMTVVAEGVENVATAELLEQLGCDVLQGYLFGRPTDHAEFLRQVVENRTHSRRSGA
jgi:EAL domain-containing protein (putative c-di-GMP-specific phosphodiesterase class I)